MLNVGQPCRNIFQLFSLHSGVTACLAYNQYNWSLVLALRLRSGLGLRQSYLLYVCYFCIPAHLVHLHVFQPFVFAVFFLPHYPLVWFFFLVLFITCSRSVCMLGGSVSLALAAAAPDLSLALFREGGGGVHCGMS